MLITYSEQCCRPAPAPLPLNIKYCAVLYRVGVRSRAIAAREKRFNMCALLLLVRESEHEKELLLKSWVYSGANKKGTGKMMFFCARDLKRARLKKGYYVCLRSSRVSLKTQLFLKKELTPLIFQRIVHNLILYELTVSTGNLAISLLEETFISQLSSLMTFLNMLGSWVTKG